MAIYHGKRLGAELVKQGICPPNARNMELHIHTDDAVFIRYDVIVDDKDYRKLQRAIDAMLQPDEIGHELRPTST